MTAGELAERFSHSWSTTTRHLQKLQGAGLVTVQPVGRERRYALDSDRLKGVVTMFLDAFDDSDSDDPNGQTRR